MVNNNKLFDRFADVVELLDANYCTDEEIEHTIDVVDSIYTLDEDEYKTFRLKLLMDSDFRHEFVNIAHRHHKDFRFVLEAVAARGGLGQYNAIEKTMIVVESGEYTIYDDWQHLAVEYFEDFYGKDALNAIYDYTYWEAYAENLTLGWDCYEVLLGYIVEFRD